MSKIKNIKRIIRYNLGIAFPILMRRLDYLTLESLTENKKVRNQLYEYELSFINDLIKENSTVIDIGANVGSYLYVLSRSKKYSRIIGFEPIPILYKRLRRYFPGMDIYKYAISDTNGDKMFKVPFIQGKVYDSRGTLHDYKESGENKSKHFLVKTITLDKFVEDFSVSNISFIKIDVEGHELSVLRGATKTISVFKPMLLIEIEQRHHIDKLITEIFDEITSFGYKGYYYHPIQKKFYSINTYNIKEYQNLNKINECYINNFIFSSIEEHLMMKNFYRIESLLETHLFMT